jgi:hypothetical protein
MQSLLIAVALVCAYLASWRPTEKRAYQCVTTRGVIFPRRQWDPKPLGNQAYVENAASPLPLVISQVEMSDEWSKSRRYYLWLFGPAVKLPIEWPIEPPDLDVPFHQSSFGKDVPAH